MTFLPATRTALVAFLLATSIAFGQDTTSKQFKPAREVRYMLVDLGLDGAANEILNSEKIIGSLNHGDPDRHATFWRNQFSPGVDLGTLPDGTGTRGAAGNEKGDVVGEDFMGDFTRAVFWDHSHGGPSSKTGPILLPGLPEGFNVASDINDAGRIVGQSFSVDTGELHAVFWSSSKTPATFLAPVNAQFPNVLAICINAGNNIIGAAYPADFSETHVAYWDKSTSKPVILAAPGGEYTQTSLGFSSGIFVAHCLTNSKRIVAFAFNADFSKTVPVYWERSSSPAQVLSINSSDYPNGMAESISENRQIVGTAYSSDYSTSHGFYWPSPDSPGVDLNTLIPPNSGYEIEIGRSINDRGEIAAIAGVNGIDHPVVLIPVHGK